MAWHSCSRLDLPYSDTRPWQCAAQSRDLHCLAACNSAHRWHTATRHVHTVRCSTVVYCAPSCNPFQCYWVGWRHFRLPISVPLRVAATRELVQSSVAQSLPARLQSASSTHSITTGLPPEEATVSALYARAMERLQAMSVGDVFWFDSPNQRRLELHTLLQLLQALPRFRTSASLLHLFEMPEQLQPHAAWRYYACVESNALVVSSVHNLCHHQCNAMQSTPALAT